MIERNTGLRAIAPNIERNYHLLPGEGNLLTYDKKYSTTLHANKTSSILLFTALWEQAVSLRRESRGKSVGMRAVPLCSWSSNVLKSTVGGQFTRVSREEASSGAV